MKTHTKQCDKASKPCGKEHTYLCPICLREYTADASTHSTVRYTVYPGPYWPACSLTCYSTRYPDSDPMLAKPKEEKKAK